MYLIIHIENFPVTLVGLGYRRQRSKRPSTLCLFQAQKATKTIRVFTDSMQVEACGIRLDAAKILNWLAFNNFINLDKEKITSPQRAFNYVHSLMNSSEMIGRIVLSLLHTISHAYIIGLSWCSGMDLPSFSEHLLPNALTTIVHTGGTSLGGLSSVFAQTPWQPLELASDDLIACQLDPSCSEDDGGSCIACIHLPLGCSMWNSFLSRAYLFGGKTKEDYVIKRGFWE